MLREILDRTAERMGRGIGNQPAVEAEMRSLIGRLYVEIGNYEGAEKMHRLALSLHESLSGTNSAETAASLNDLGVALWKLRKLAEAEAGASGSPSDQAPAPCNAHADVASSLNNWVPSTEDNRSSRRRKRSRGRVGNPHGPVR